MAKDLVGCLVLLGELLRLRKLLFQLLDSLLGTLFLQFLDLGLFVLALDVNLSTPSLGARLEQERTNALRSCNVGTEKNELEEQSSEGC